ncbi:MAG: hypothetical protein WBC93_15805 [Sulfitobacter sp.]
MNFFVIMFAIIALIGVVVAIYEWRIKKALLRHDLMRYYGRQDKAKGASMLTAKEMTGRMIISQYPPN